MRMMLVRRASVRSWAEGIIAAGVVLLVGACGAEPNPGSTSSASPSHAPASLAPLATTPSSAQTRSITAAPEGMAGCDSPITDNLPVVNPPDNKLPHYGYGIGPVFWTGQEPWFDGPPGSNRASGSVGARHGPFHPQRSSRRRTGPVRRPKHDRPIDILSMGIYAGTVHAFRSGLLDDDREVRQLDCSCAIQRPAGSATARMKGPEITSCAVSRSV